MPHARRAPLAGDVVVLRVVIFYVQFRRRRRATGGAGAHVLVGVEEVGDATGIFRRGRLRRGWGPVAVGLLLVRGAPLEDSADRPHLLQHSIQLNSPSEL